MMIGGAINDNGIGFFSVIALLIIGWAFLTTYLIKRTNYGKKQTVVEKYDKELKQEIEEQLELFKAGKMSHLFLINRINKSYY